MSVNTILLKDMPFSLVIGTDAWRRTGKAQPVKINFEVHNVHIIEEAALSDDVSRSLDYGKLYKSIQRRMEAADSFASVRRVAEALLSTLTGPNVTATGEIELPKAALRAEGGLVYGFEEDRNPRALSEYETLSIRGIRCYCILGVNAHERRDKQLVDIKIDFHDLPTVGNVLEEYHDLIPAVVDLVEVSDYESIEALATVVCKEVVTEWRAAAAEVTIEKPYAMPGIGAAGVRIRRRQSFYTRANRPARR